MKLVLVLLSLLAVAALAMASFIFYGMRAVRKLVLRDIDLSQIADGVYVGSFHKGRFTYDVEVSVKDHRIVAIKNSNPRTSMIPDWNTEAEASIIQKQGLNVDAVSGATLSTKAFGKAVEIALSAPARR